MESLLLNPVNTGCIDWSSSFCVRDAPVSYVTFPGTEVCAGFSAVLFYFPHLKTRGRGWENNMLSECLWRREKKIERNRQATFHSLRETSCDLHGKNGRPLRGMKPKERQVLESGS